MQIKFSVDQHEAILAGINAPSATVHLDVHPVWLTSAERAVLAAVLSDGNDATRLGITWYDDEVTSDRHGVKLSLLTPGLDGLRAAIAAALAEAIDQYDAQYARSVSVEDWVA